MRRPRASVTITLAAVAAAGIPAAANAAPATPAAKSPAAAKTVASRLPADRSWKVTLLTGDTVQVHTVKNRLPMVSVQPGKGRTNVPFVRDIRPDGTIRVIPADVGRLIGKKIDPALFNITTLIKEGNDDASRSTLPLIVQGGDGEGRNLKAVHATAVRQAKGRRPAALTASGKLASGVQHIWLDRKVKVSKLDRNLDQIGAPAAWKAGATGKGVKVAVLDTGVDATHPDLKGQIAEQENFATGSTDTVDRFGHGTHVAATIAGTGAAANGERKGVAPDSQLLVGKVLGDDGQGYESDVIKGMEWGASKAKIVSMSLGSSVDDTPDPDSDPVAKAADDLTAQYGTLFVVAAGNDGDYGDNTIGSPGIAPSALTVGAVDGKDTLASFSSRGGVLLKPDIAAPGVDIVAARAAGTTMGSPVDATYTAASGTSMATPHVAGAAADLLQKHPDWTSARLKAALTSTAHAVPGTVYQVGAGRLDVAAATSATVTADDSGVAFGHIAHGSTEAVTKKLSWTNTGTSPVELRLAATLADHAGRDSGAAQVPASVTVPAGGTASATLTLNPGRLTTAGYYSGTVTAQAGGIALHTPVGAYAEPETHTLTLKATPFPGTADGDWSAYVGVLNLDDPNHFSQVPDFDASGVATVQVAAGRYAVLGNVDSYVDRKTNAYRTALVGTAEVNVDRDTTVALDASKAEPVKIAAPGASNATDVLVHAERGTPDGIWGFDILTLNSSISPNVYTNPIESPQTGTLQVYVGARVSSDDGKTVYDLLHGIGSGVPEKIDYTADPKDLARVDERFHALGGDTTKPVWQKRYGVTPAGALTTEVSGNVAAGSARTDYVSAETGIGWLEEAAPPNNAGLDSWAPQVPLRHYSAGSSYADDWARQPIRPGPYSATGVTPSVCVPGPTTRARGNIHVELVDLQDRIDGFDCVQGDMDGVSTRTMKLYANGTLAGTTTHYYGDFTVPATAGTYQLVYDLDASKVLPVSGKTSTTWTFRSKPGETRVPLLTVDYALPLDLLNHPDGDTATFTVARVKGSAAAKATGLKLWTSLDDGTTWQPATVTYAGNGKYTGTLPKAGKDQGVSLRVQATDNGGGKIDQTIIRAYTGG
ncbi:S8 family serine peptidase [Actinoallomurus acanthiterrae]